MFILSNQVVDCRFPHLLGFTLYFFKDMAEIAIEYQKQLSMVSIFHNTGAACHYREQFSLSYISSNLFLPFDFVHFDWLTSVPKLILHTYMHAYIQTYIHTHTYVHTYIELQI